MGQHPLDRRLLRDRRGGRDIVRPGRGRPLDHHRHADAPAARLAARDRAGAVMSDDLPAALPYAEVIGDPIAQSKSPLIHGFWLDALGLAGRYARAHVKPEGLAAYIAAPPDRKSRVQGKSGYRRLCTG